MSHLLIKVVGNLFMNQTLWEPSLSVFDDFIVYRRRNWFVVREITIPYKQIAQVDLTIGIFFSEIEIAISGNETRTLKVNYVINKDALRAKKIIDQKVHLVHSQDEKLNTNVQVKSFEKSLARLTELLEKKKITKKEYEKRRKEIINKSYE